MVTVEQLSLSPAEQRAYPRWYTDLLLRKRHDTVAVGDLLKFVDNFGIAELDKHRISKFMEQPLVVIEPVQFYMFLRLCGHLLQGQQLRKELAFVSAPVPRPRPILSKRKQEKGDKNPFGLNEMDSFMSLMAGTSGSSGGKKKRVTFSEKPQVAEAAQRSMQELMRQRALAPQPLVSPAPVPQPQQQPQKPEEEVPLPQNQFAKVNIESVLHEGHSTIPAPPPPRKLTPNMTGPGQMVEMGALRPGAPMSSVVNWQGQPGNFLQSQGTGNSQGSGLSPQVTGLSAQGTGPSAQGTGLSAQGTGNSGQYGLSSQSTGLSQQVPQTFQVTGPQSPQGSQVLQPPQRIRSQSTGGLQTPYMAGQTTGSSTPSGPFVHPQNSGSSGQNLMPFHTPSPLQSQATLSQPFLQPPGKNSSPSPISGNAFVGQPPAMPPRFSSPQYQGQPPSQPPIQQPHMQQPPHQPIQHVQPQGQFQYAPQYPAQQPGQQLGQYQQQTFPPVQQPGPFLPVHPPGQPQYQPGYQYQTQNLANQLQNLNINAWSQQPQPYGGVQVPPPPRRNFP